MLGALATPENMILFELLVAASNIIRINKNASPPTAAVVGVLPRDQRRSPGASDAPRKQTVSQNLCFAWNRWTLNIFFMVYHFDIEVFMDGILCVMWANRIRKRSGTHCRNHTWSTATWYIWNHSFWQRAAIFFAESRYRSAPTTFRLGASPLRSDFAQRVHARFDKYIKNTILWISTTGLRNWGVMDANISIFPISPPLSLSLSQLSLATK